MREVLTQIFTALCVLLTQVQSCCRSECSGPLGHQQNHYPHRPGSRRMAKIFLCGGPIISIYEGLFSVCMTMQLPGLGCLQSYTAFFINLLSNLANPNPCAVPNNTPRLPVARSRPHLIQALLYMCLFVCPFFILSLPLAEFLGPKPKTHKGANTACNIQTRRVWRKEAASHQLRERRIQHLPLSYLQLLNYKHIIY